MLIAAYTVAIYHTVSRDKHCRHRLSVGHTIDTIFDGGDHDADELLSCTRQFKNISDFSSIKTRRINRPGDESPIIRLCSGYSLCTTALP